MQREPITPEGYQKLKTELHRLKTKERPSVIQAISEARGHGDLKENAEYHAAREKQSLLEARILELEYLLSVAEIINHKDHQANKKVIFGSTVTVLDLNTDSQKKFQIVGKFESDIKSGKIPVSSPIAKALIGKQEGEGVSVQVPKGLQEFEILKIEFI